MRVDEGIILPYYNTVGLKEYERTIVFKKVIQYRKRNTLIHYSALILFTLVQYGQQFLEFYTKKHSFNSQCEKENYLSLLNLGC